MVVWLLIILLLSVGNLYLKLHALPERMAHQQNSAQMQLIAVLAVLALFTHNNVFWVAALLLTVVRFPDFSTPINSISESLAELVRRADSPSSDERNEAVSEKPPRQGSQDSED